MASGGRRKGRLTAVVVVATTLVAAACANTHERPPVRFPPNAAPSLIVDSQGRPITSIADENRQSVPLSSIPVTMQQAIVAIEDASFWTHNGVDVKAIARAADANAEAGEVSQGGSTITQQYVKNALLDDERTISRKVEEAALAMAVERAYSKEVILEQYLNTIYFGSGAYGVQAAALDFFGVPASQLTLAQSALLAGAVQSPTRWDPRINPENSTSRRNLVLARMEEEGYISPEQEASASAEPLGVVDEVDSPEQVRYPAAHFVEEVKRWLLHESDAIGDNQAERYNNLLRGGLTITTTIDLDMQAKAEAAINEVLPNMGSNPKIPDAALTTIDPATGYIRAMVGGRDFWGEHPYAKLNLAEGSGRSTGSAFKPIVLATALSNGVPLDRVYDSPSGKTFRIPGGEPWSVKGGGGLGRANMAQCTQASSNTCYAGIVLDPDVGPEDSAEMATQLGITSTQIGTAPSMVLGAYNATVRDMASVYATFANGGVHVPPVYVTKVERADGTVLYEHEHAQAKVLEPEVSRVVNGILPLVIEGGTGKKAAIDWPAGGKTGSAQDNSDAWFTGFTHQLATAVWVGFSEPRPRSNGQLGLVPLRPPNTPRTVWGGEYPAEIWAEFMTLAMDGLPQDPLNAPLPPPTTTTTSPSPPDILDPLEQARTRTARVPDVVNMIERNATASLRRAGFAVEVAIVDLGEEAMPGRTVVQSPPSGAEMTPGSTVWLEVTKGSPASRTPIPDVRGYGTGQAVEELEALGFEVTTRLVAPPEGTLSPAGVPYEGGQVWATSPAIGELAPDGAVVLDYAPEPAPPTTTTTAAATPED
ncbi:MAG: hypothetical protein GY812_05770 [Actinomycetia bacterium]|nr:hypothetical protein [Actinomycetes bacterium]